jgi:MFS transporter, BCD family, chlorophyll transporter
MESTNFNDERDTVESSDLRGRLTTVVMVRLGLFQVALGMMSVLVQGVLNRVLIKELSFPEFLTGVLLALTLFVSPMRLFFGQLSDRRPLLGYHRTSYVWCGTICLAILATIAPRVMWLTGDSLQSTGWSSQTIAMTALLALLMAAYGIAVSAASTPFATLLVDVSTEKERGKLVGIDWSMLIGGTIVGAITLGILLNPLKANAPIADVKAAIDRVFLIIPAIVCTLAAIATWQVERKYSRFQERNLQTADGERMTFKQAWTILTSNPQTKLFFAFLLCMTMGLFIQDPILEPFGAEVFGMTIGETTALNAFWGSGTLIGLIVAGSTIVPRLGKRETAKLGCKSVPLSLILVMAAGISKQVVFLKVALLVFGVASGIITTGAISLMLDLTIAETAGTFIGAWGLSQAFARGTAFIVGGATLSLGKLIFPSNLSLAYLVPFLFQATAMLVALQLINRVNVREFQQKARETIVAVMSND